MIGQAEIDRFLMDVMERWNCGDLKGLCELYDETAMYVSATSGVRVGRDAIYQNYQSAFPDASVMGTLTLAIVSGITTFSVEDKQPRSVAWFTVEWTLRRGAASANGYSTVILMTNAAGELLTVQDTSV